MRNAVVGFIALTILILSGLSILSIQNKTLRENELDSNVSTAMEQAMTSAMDEGKLIGNGMRAELLEADVISHLLLKTTSDSAFQVNILSVDMEKGLLDIEVQETFPQFAGITGQAVCRKTIIVEEYEEEREIYYPVRFRIDTETVKEIQVLNGSLLQKMGPEQPAKKGYTFSGWKLDGSDVLYKDISSICVSKELNFNAVFRR